MKTLIFTHKNILVPLVVLLLFAALYLVHVGPVRRAIGRRAETARRLEVDLAWMKNAVASRGREKTVMASGSLLTLVDRSVGEAGIRTAVTRVAADGDKSVRVWFGEVRFAALAAWLARVGKIGLVVRACRVNEQDGGMVKAEVRLLGQR